MFVKTAYVRTAHGDSPLVAAVHAAQNIQNSRFACAAAADYHGKLALFYFKRDTVNSRNSDLAHFVSFIYVLKVNKRTHIYTPSIR